MTKIELILPKMGESVAEATVTSWLKNEGDFVELEEGIIEIAQSYKCRAMNCLPRQFCMDL